MPVLVPATLSSSQHRIVQQHLCSCLGSENRKKFLWDVAVCLISTGKADKSGTKQFIKSDINYQHARNQLEVVKSAVFLAMFAYKYKAHATRNLFLCGGLQGSSFAALLFQMQFPVVSAIASCKQRCTGDYAARSYNLQDT